MSVKFEAGINIAIKIPKSKYEKTVAFYRDVLMLEVEELIIPDDLEDAFAGRKGAKDYFLSLSKSSKKSLLHWIVLAKLPETRQKRIDEISELAEKGMKPKQFR